MSRNSNYIRSLYTVILKLILKCTLLETVKILSIDFCSLLISWFLTWHMGVFGLWFMRQDFFLGGMGLQEWPLWQISTLQPTEEPPMEQVDVAWRRIIFFTTSSKPLRRSKRGVVEFSCPHCETTTKKAGKNTNKKTVPFKTRLYYLLGLEKQTFRSNWQVLLWSLIANEVVFYYLIQLKYTHRELLKQLFLLGLY